MNKETLTRWILFVLPDVQDLLVFGGLACACLGVAQIYAPAAWILAGVVLFWLGIRR